jgi:hypothetical protein
VLWDWLKQATKERLSQHPMVDASNPLDMRLALRLSPFF